MVHTRATKARSRRSESLQELSGDLRSSDLAQNETGSRTLARRTVSPALSQSVATPPQHAGVSRSSQPLSDELSRPSTSTDIPGLDATPNEGVQSDTTRPEVRKKARTKRRSPSTKLQRVVKCLDDCGWTFEDFIKCWLGLGSDRDIHVARRRYSSNRQRQVIFGNLLTEIYSKGDMRWPIEATILKELTDLMEKTGFDKHDATASLDDLDFATAFTAMRETAPTWYGLLQSLLRHHRGHQPSYGAGSALSSDKRVFAITSIICHAQARATSNSFTAKLSAYLLGSGTKRRVIETLAGLGFCYSYKHTNRLMQDIANEAKRQLKILAKDPQTVVVYDNLNFMETKRDEVLGHRASMQSVTTAALVHCPGLPPEGLFQSMHNPSIALQLRDIVELWSDEKVSHAISKAIISDAVRSVHREGVDIIFQGGEGFPTMPIVERLSAQQTKFWQLGAIHENEGTIQGTYKVHSNIFLDQLGYRTSEDPETDAEDVFKTRLFLAHGDQLTASHIRSVKAEQSQAARPYDRREWLLGIPAWFHVQSNLLNTIVRTHWGPVKAGVQTRHSLKSDITTWNRSFSSRDSIKYHQIEPLVGMSFKARVVALFYTVMRRKGFLSAHSTSREEINSLIAHLTPLQFHEIVEEIYQTAFTWQAWTGKGPQEHGDLEYRTMCRMLREIELFLAVRFAVKVGDIGLLRYLVNQLIVFFFGAGQNKYGNEMLFYRWNLSEVNDPRLQHAILASGLVNWHGKQGTFKAIDLSLEHLNGNCKIEMKCYRNSTHDTDITLDRVCLSNTYTRQLRSKLEDAFGNHMSGSHTTDNAILDMFMLARLLFTSDQAEPRIDSEIQLVPDMFDSHDIIQKGVDVLEEKVKLFNSKHVRSDPYGFVSVDEEAASDADSLDHVEGCEDEDVLILEDTVEPTAIRDLNPSNRHVILLEN